MATLLKYVLFSFLLAAALHPTQAQEEFVLANNQARAHWHSKGQINVRQPAPWRLGEQFRYYLYYGEFQVEGGLINEGAREPLEFVRSSKDWIYLDSSKLESQISWLIRQRLAIVTLNHLEQVVDITYLQLGDLLDQMFFYEGNDLGLRFDSYDRPHFKLWAPTAKSVRIHLYDDPRSVKSLSDEVFALEPSESGTWKIQGESNWKDKYYLYEVEVFMPESDRVELNFVTDPYSVSLATNSIKSHIINVEDDKWKPTGWDELEKPEFKGALQSVLYELHVRDFSIRDQSQPAEYRGGFMAFTNPESNGVKHLQGLTESGLTHVHLMPIADFVTVEEDLSRQLIPSIPINAPADSTTQQESIRFVRSQDGYNWGYDPYHYFVPEGSYSTNPMGGERIKELRAMVQSLNSMGLRVVQDVVFNHTFSGGLSPYSVLDKVVPGYYYRMNDFGQVQNSSCCTDTASERRMMEKLMLDAVEHWAITFKMDGFRFDLMNLHTRDNAKAVVKRIRSLNENEHGVNGNEILIYGEGWDFGSLKDANKYEPFTQHFSYGLGIATFNDRMRDALRGGTTSEKEKSDQGFVTGLYYDFNHDPSNRNTPQDLESQRYKLMHLADVVRIGMAGNLKEFVFTDHMGSEVMAKDILYRGTPTGYAASPFETISYVSAHDGYTLFDAINSKAPFHTPGRIPSTASMDDRVRMQKLALASVAFSQGIPFFHGGSELLRSKSGDVDSYDSGDWFNYLDYSYETNNWGVGLPPEWKNHHDWGFWQSRLAGGKLKPSSDHIKDTHQYFKALLKVRTSTPLFSLTSTAEVQRRVRFLNGELGQRQKPGLIVMQLTNATGSTQNLDPDRDRLIVVINANSNEMHFSHVELKDRALSFHPAWTKDVEPRVEHAAFDFTSGTIRVPGRTVLVLEEAR